MDFSNIKNYHNQIISGKLKVIDAVNYYIHNIENDKHTNAIVTKNYEAAQKKAEESQKKFNTNQQRLLEGVIVSVKDMFCTEGLLTTAASKILSNFVPPYSATVVSKIEEEGAIIIGKANQDEFAMGNSNTSGIFGKCYNPAGYDIGEKYLTPGGSSGGSAASVKAKQAMVSLGTDTGGSVRQPASLTGLYGMKPTYGFCSRYGIIAYGSSLDQAGVIANNLKDLALTLDVIIGHDEKDSTSLNINPPKLLKNLNEQNSNREKNNSKANITIGIPYNLFELSDTQECKSIWGKIESLNNHENNEGKNIVIKPITLANIKHAINAYYIIAMCEAASNLARYDGVRYGLRATDYSNLEEMYLNTRTEGFGLNVQKRIMAGNFALSTGFYEQYYVKALKIRNLILQDFKKAFSQVDAIVMPTSPCAAWNSDAEMSEDKSFMLDMFSAPANLAGLPAISIPFMTNNKNLPLGLQIIADQRNDAKVLQVASNVEKIIRNI